MYQYRIDHVKKVSSGDTLHLIVDLGFHTLTEVSVTLLGVETPEYGSFDRMGNDEGAAARAATIQWFTEHPRPWVVQTTKERRDDFQRWQATIFDAEGKDLAEDLVTGGYAKYLD